MSDVVKDMSNYIHLSKYSKWINSEKRREKTWEESCSRLFSFWVEKVPEILSEELKPSWRRAADSIAKKKSMPSMRSLMTAGPALIRDNMAGFNCAAVAITHPIIFSEIFHTLMNGTGVGYSVERQYINKLPDLPESLHDSDTVIIVKDSKAGWAKGLKELISMLYGGDVPKWDLSRVRPAGARLKTFGGRASGPEPLDRLFSYTVQLFRNCVNNKKNKLNSLECHDLVCKIADTVIVGSVRRSACICLSNLTDLRMASAKSGNWYDTNPERALANNSVAYTEKPDLQAFLKEMLNLYVSKSGERGIVNKEALRAKAESCGREHEGDYLLNPCGEAILRDTGGLCNLTEIVVTPDDTLFSLEKKAEASAIFGSLQSTLTDFKFVRKVWQRNQEEERLLGVSITGVMDHEFLSGRLSYMLVIERGDILDTEQKVKVANKLSPHGREWVLGDSYPEHLYVTLPSALAYLKEVVRETNNKWADVLGVPRAKQLTLIKPSGTVSQLVGCSAGMHPRFAPYYLRRVTQDIKDPLTDLMIAEGIPHYKQKDKVYFSFPMKSPEGAVCAKDIGPIDQLELWKVYREYWCDGNPSQTIYYTDENFTKVQDWVYSNWDIVGGLSFLAVDNNSYDPNIMPYLEITEEEYNKKIEEFPKKIHWDRLPEFEKEDNTTGSQEYACVGNSCEL